MVCELPLTHIPVTSHVYVLINKYWSTCQKHYYKIQLQAIYLQELFEKKLRRIPRADTFSSGVTD